VGVDAAQRGLEEPVGHECHVLLGKPPPAQGLAHQAGQGGGGDGPQTALASAREETGLSPAPIRSRTKRASRAIPSAICSSVT